MTREQFIALRRQSWERFDALLAKAERSHSPKLTGEEVSEFARLFRSLCYDLSLVRSRDWGLALGRHLNDLVARGHNSFYRAPPGSARRMLVFFTAGFPRLLRKNIAYFWVALFLFTVPGLICGLVVSREPSLAGRILPGTVLTMLEQMYSQDLEHRGPSGMESGMAGFYVHNNVGIAFRCFATGIFFGIGSIFFLVYNSIFLGTVSGYLVARGHSERFFSFVISHGSFELTAIVISGAAGLVIGHALVHPGEYTRAEALRRRGFEAIQLAAGAGAMLAVAALIEAFWSPSGFPKEAKYAVGTALWICVVLFLSLGGRAEPES